MEDHTISSGQKLQKDIQRIHRVYEKNMEVSYEFKDQQRIEFELREALLETLFNSMGSES